MLENLSKGERFVANMALGSTAYFSTPAIGEAVAHTVNGGWGQFVPGFANGIFDALAFGEQTGSAIGLQIAHNLGLGQSGSLIPIAAADLVLIVALPLASKVIAQDVFINALRAATDAFDNVHKAFINRKLPANFPHFKIKAILKPTAKEAGILSGMGLGVIEGGSILWNVMANGNFWNGVIEPFVAAGHTAGVAVLPMLQSLHIANGLTEAVAGLVPFLTILGTQSLVVGDVFNHLIGRHARRLANRANRISEIYEDIFGASLAAPAIGYVMEQQFPAVVTAQHYTGEGLVSELSLAKRTRPLPELFELPETIKTLVNDAMRGEEEKNTLDSCVLPSAPAMNADVLHQAENAVKSGDPNNIPGEYRLGSMPDDNIPGQRKR